MSVAFFPLSSYRDASFYAMRTDALDRLGTRLEKRFNRAQIIEMLTAAGLEKLLFSNRLPYWVALGTKIRS